jgi:hypothetical protein
MLIYKAVGDWEGHGCHTVQGTNTSGNCLHGINKKNKFFLSDRPSEDSKRAPL